MRETQKERLERQRKEKQRQMHPRHRAHDRHEEQKMADAFMREASSGHTSRLFRGSHVDVLVQRGSNGIDAFEVVMHGDKILHWSREKGFTAYHKEGKRLVQSGGHDLVTYRDTIKSYLSQERLPDASISDFVFEKLNREHRQEQRTGIQLMDLIS